METLRFQAWPEQTSCFKLSYDAETCSQLSNVDLSMSHSPENDQDRLNTKKMAIPRLPEGAEAAFSSPGRFHRRHVRRACESCRQRKTKCTGDKSGCRNCREAGIICCYTDGKREKSKRQLASLSAKVQAYEDVIRKLSLSFGISDEQLMNSAMSAESPHRLSLHPDFHMATSRGRQNSGSSSSGYPQSRSSSVGSFDEVDRVEEDFNRDHTTRATGYIGKSSEIAWLQKLSREVSHESEVKQESPSHERYSPAASSKDEGSIEPSIASSSYYLDDTEITIPARVDPYGMPSRDVAARLFNAYLASVHPSFPIIGISTFISQYQLFFNQPSVKPGNKWLAILNLIFAIAAKYSHISRADWRDNEDDHQLYFARARMLSMNDQLFDHPDLQQIQVEGLASFYLLAMDQINRAWKLCGNAVRAAVALGLHLRNVGSSTSDTSKEIRYRVWWSLYTIDHLLSVMTGRPTCIVDSTCTTPLPVPFDECDFQKEEVTQLIGNSSRRNSYTHDKMSDCSNTPSPAQLEIPSMEPPSAKLSEVGSTEWLKGLAPSMSLYFLQLSTLTSISKRVNAKLYSAESVQSPWPSIEFMIQSLMLETDSWLLNLPEPYDFTSVQMSQALLGQRMSLACLFYSTKIAITRPCLCRLDASRPHGSKSYDFCSKTAAECVDSACRLLRLLPDAPDSALLCKIAPWWCMLHYIMQATTVLLLELSFRAQHVPDKAATVSKAAKTGIEWLHHMSTFSAAASRAWKLCDDYLRRLAPHVGVEVNDLPCNDEAVINDMPAVDFSSVSSSFDSTSCPLMDHASPPAPIFPYSLEQPDMADFIKPEKCPPIRSGYDDYLPYDPATGHLTGSFFPSSTNLDLELGYMWGDTMC
ncbi:transcriptional regulator family: Fungal Specific TF [Paecilomyces variotii]|nr:transcriptional regulator family: Fungal Specific TF [Paecilomyces variotii]KAJ9282381.1 transcriptional regulator family: Fungal Specific TF [Paecilomyces variotii]KAJ9344107.1 transcriptional regulator family: Fungal Specific TF [Paecilomyces variotii]KAJ9389725.1 transcriptional regulator family: Fungal Specific TF [Paecilomyces variotii]KAJ9407642.1 transcriptional regulator family: Fungal Specific TF [Paecilomyces variotii]